MEGPARSKPDATLHQVELGLNRGGDKFWGPPHLMILLVAAKRDAGADLSPSVPSCDWNRFNIQYALAVSKQRGVKRVLEPVDTEEGTDASDEDSLHLLRAAGEEEEEEEMLL